ncbi:MAG: DUF58 domain-containing protein [Brevinematales bacterium]|nr:DUF58 domain-containing protein [Brevinematales bacterium]
MPWGSFFIAFIFLLFNFLFLDFPGAKIILYASFIFFLVNYLYYRFVINSIKIERANKEYFLFSGINENSIINVYNSFFLPIHGLIVNDQSDLNISVRQVYSFLVSLKGKEKKEIFYSICGKKRGLYLIGPTTIKFTDICGIFSFEMEIDTKREIVVFPNIYKFYELPYKSQQPQGAFRNKLPIYEDVSLIKGLKEYQPGDELKRINWKISARQNKILVNTYQYSVSLDSIIILNLFEEDYDFREKSYYIETAIDIATSLVYYLQERKQNYGFIANAKTNEDKILNFPPANGNEHLINIVSNLSIIEPSKNISFSENLKELKNLKWGVSLYLITPELKEGDIPYLIEINKSGHPINIFNFGPRINREVDLRDVGFSRYFLEVESGIIKMLNL